MREKYMPIVFIICLLYCNESCGYVATDDIDAGPILPRLTRLAKFDQPVITENKRREVLDRLRSYFRWPYPPFTALNIPVYTSEGVGEVVVSGNDISSDGVTAVEGTVPINGGVNFGGPVRASGTVTIAGRFGPARYSPLSIIPPRFPLLPANTPTETRLIDPLPPPSYPPTIILPPVVIPAFVVPAYVLPEVVIPRNVVERGSGFGEVVVTGDDVVVSGETQVDGVLTTTGEVTFGGCVAAKGGVTICGHF